MAASIALERSAPPLAIARSTDDAEISVHDTSRVEWRAMLALPETGRALRYSIELELEIPSHLFAPHAPWVQMQSFARLDGSVFDTSASETLREARVVARAADGLERAAMGFARHLTQLVSVGAADAIADQLAALTLWIDAARETVARARTLGRAVSSKHGGASTHAQLADDYLGTQLIAFVSSAMRAVDEIRQSKPALDGELRAVELALSSLLAEETRHRMANGYPVCDDASESMEALVLHANRLKKHFQGPLFLRVDAFYVADRLRNWLAVLVAVLASSWAIVGQVLLASRSAAVSLRFGSGLLALLIAGGAIYAIKDRIKEIGREWLSKRVRKVYGERVVRYLSNDPRAEVIARAVESIDVTTNSPEEPLADGCRTTLAHTRVRFVHRGELAPRAARGAIRLTFRYDLSPVFSRLHDPEKPLAVLDPVDAIARLRRAPRTYRFPMRLSVRGAGESLVEEQARLVVDKQGLRRVERGLTTPTSAG